MRYFTIDDPNGTELRAIRMDRRWFPAHHCTRDDREGLWDCIDLPAGPAPQPAGGERHAVPEVYRPAPDARSRPRWPS